MGNDVPLTNLKTTLKEFSTLLRKVNSVTEIDTGPLDFKKDIFPRMRSMEARVHLSDCIRQACGADIFEDAHKLISLTHQLYDQFKRISETPYSTHRYITEQALKLVGANTTACATLMEYCTFPDDRKSDMQDLIFEGHFFGKTQGGPEGNFLNNLFPAAMVILEAIKKATHGFDEDIHEHALMNFVRNFASAGKDDKGCAYLGVAAHYLQDLTAPHHVGNYPAVPYVDHFFFEKFASETVYLRPGFQITDTDYDAFKRSLKSSPSQPGVFAREIYGRAVKFAACISESLHSATPGTDHFAEALEQAVDSCSGYLSNGNPQWEEAINNAIPLAVYSTAYLFETVLLKEEGGKACPPGKRCMEEVLPVVSLDTVAPPYLKYRYFEGHESRPFRSHVTVFDMQNAWWLIEASTLVYADPQFVAGQFHNAGFKEVQFFDARETDTQCFVASNERFMIVAFRGTEIRKRAGRLDFRNVLADIATDANFCLVDSGQGGKVHRGFKEALDSLWEKEGLFQYIKNMSNRNGRRLPVWFTGHSLGAALATLAADRYGDVQGLYTFGSPRVGDAEFKNDFHINTYRFVNHNDIVTRVPPPGLYCHVGELKYIDREGQIHDNSARWERVTKDIAREAQHIFNGLGQMRGGFTEAIPDILVDHVPLLYATHIWNNIP